MLTIWGIPFGTGGSIKKMKMNNQLIFVRIATVDDIKYVSEIVNETALSAISRGTGIASRSPESVAQKMRDGKAVIALNSCGQWVGFAYIEVWEQGKFVSNSGLIVAPMFRNSGVAKSIKNRIFRISRRAYPDAKVFSITSGPAVMKMNTQLGFQPVSFAEITQDDQFWEGCKSCSNYQILKDKNKRNCLCTAMLFDPLLLADHGLQQEQEFHQRYNKQQNSSI